MTPASSPRFSGVSSDRPDAGDGRFRDAPLARPRVRIAEPDHFSLAARRVLEEVAEVVLEPCPRGRIREALDRHYLAQQARIGGSPNRQNRTPDPS